MPVGGLGKVSSWKKLYKIQMVLDCYHFLVFDQSNGHWRVILN